MTRVIAILLLALLMGGCRQAETPVLSVADQYGLAYAPLEIMKHEGLLEKQLGGAGQVRWIKLANTAAIREAMLADELDIGFMAIPPFLIGADTGMPWQIFTGLSQTPLGLTVKGPDITSLAQLKGRGKIALPQPGSVQHILLAMAAEAQLGDPRAFDTQLVAMKHPDGLQALLAGTEVSAHFTAPPYLEQELASPEVHLLLSGEEAFGGPFTFIVGVADPDFLGNDAQCRAFMAALEEALSYMAQQPEATVRILAEAYDMAPEDVSEQLYSQGLHFGTEVSGVSDFIVFMSRAGYLEGTLNSEALVWTTLP